MRKLFIGVFFLLAAVSCKKEGALLIVNENTSFTGSIKASVDSVVLMPANDSDSVVTITWPAVSYGTGVAVTYTLELDLPGDTAGTAGTQGTAGTEGWAKATSFIAGPNVLHYSFAGKDLNNLMQTLSVFGATPLVFRVLSNVTQYNGAASTVPTTYSSVVSVVVTPYTTNLFVPGAYQGWNPATAPLLNPVAGKAGLFEGYVDIVGSGNQGFKYTNAPDWNHINYGDPSGEVGGGTLTTNGLAGGLSVANGGYYELTANLNNLTWTATSTTWSIIGDATPGGWNTDTQMTYDATNQVWTVTAAMVTAGSFKFRANDAWVIDFGIDNSGNLQYADNPFFGYTAGLNNLTVPTNGTYIITLDLHISGKYTYTALLQ
jgi:starch-binding outer membrane protein SusE/F